MQARNWNQMTKMKNKKMPERDLKFIQILELSVQN